MCTAAERLCEAIKSTRRRNISETIVTIFSSDFDYYHLESLVKEARTEGFEGVSFDRERFSVNMEMFGGKN